MLILRKGRYTGRIKQREWARLQGLTGGFVVLMSLTQVCPQFGNFVVGPLVAASVVRMMARLAVLKTDTDG